MTDLRKAAEDLLEAFDWDWSEPRNEALRERMEALRQALAQEATMQVTGEAFVLDRGCWERGCVAYDERDGDGVNISAERVDETAKGEHEPVAIVNEGMGGIEWLYKPLPDDTLLYAAPQKREWQGLTDEEREQATGWSVEHIESYLKEKNNG